ncbi:MAG: hypothetical protein C0601_05950 [Candidatus Muiribacterium halophilum]|uniref:O-methyltransferase n=1 Tax=Muiribacterium halophilum TaxID=2053465 RepID=A0A2N5ZH87_MUIH1|nr:MAG: hypothetical protein C0601_05950 [Candidatus Muirbacterium halophilum]
MDSLFLKKVRTEADIYKIPRIKDEGFEFIKQLVIDHKIESVLEIGSGNGYSTLLYFTLPYVRKILTFEYNPKRYNLARHNLKNNKNIRILNQDFLEYFESGERFDLIFIDGMKRKYIDFFKHSLRFAKHSTIFISDNINFTGFDKKDSIPKKHQNIVKSLKEYREYLTKLDGFDTKIFPDKGDGIAITKKR